MDGARAGAAGPHYLTTSIGKLGPNLESNLNGKDEIQTQSCRLICRYMSGARAGSGAAHLPTTSIGSSRLEHEGIFPILPNSNPQPRAPDSSGPAAALSLISSFGGPRPQEEPKSNRDGDGLRCGNNERLIPASQHRSAGPALPSFQPYAVLRSQQTGNCHSVVPGGLARSTLHTARASA